jgi:Ca-activated chloride channel family protein
MPTFAYPSLLWLLLLVPPLVWWELARKRLALRFSDAVFYRDIPAGRRPVAHWLGLGFRAGGLGLLLLAIAGPRWPDRGSRIPTEGIAIAILLDVSGSMGQLDYPWNDEKVSRLEAVKKVFRLFVEGGATPEGTRLEGRGNDLIALIPFANVPEDLCPLTLSHDVLLRMLDEQEARAVPDESNTNIGGAIIWGLKRLDGAGTRRKVLILLSDGEHNVPDAVKPRHAAQLAHNLQVPVYTIDAGADPAPEPGGQAPDEKLVESRANAKRTMEDVARITGGKYFDARDGQGLVKACQEIDRLETQRLETFYYRKYHEGYPWFALASLILLAGTLALERTFWRRVP